PACCGRRSIPFLMPAGAWLFRWPAAPRVGDAPSPQLTRRLATEPSPPPPPGRPAIPGLFLRTPMLSRPGCFAVFVARGACRRVPAAVFLSRADFRPAHLATRPTVLGRRRFRARSELIADILEFLSGRLPVPLAVWSFRQVVFRPLRAVSFPPPAPDSVEI